MGKSDGFFWPFGLRLSGGASASVAGEAQPQPSLLGLTREQLRMSSLELLVQATARERGSKERSTRNRDQPQKRPLLAAARLPDPSACTHAI